MIGAGEYVFPRYVAGRHPQATVEVPEIDPGVIGFNRQHLRLTVDSPIISHAGDARLFLNGVSVPYHLTTLEFHQHVKRSMTPDGLYLVNLIDSGHLGRFVQAYVNTVRRMGVPWATWSR